ncbi:CDP-alcohol phosphatidyltransferase family protein [Nocardiopsis sp. CNT312]|uniref:CDP-alcohol phosphatidyltransferase family protein n=1 Tax=Nocardiopsis sp. CNT312 TaxID=1137268 RepID=UPI0004AD2FC0
MGEQSTRAGAWAPTARGTALWTAGEAGTALVAQSALLWALVPLAGLGPLGWGAGALHAAALTGLLLWAMHRRGRTVLGTADRVTLSRAVLGGGVLALAVDGGPAWALVALASVALVLDLVDGAVARGSGSASEFGARFDMEADAFLILVLSAYVSLHLGPWVLAVGLLRYLFAAGARVAPFLRAPLPPSTARKVVAAAQGVVLTAAASGVPAHALSVIAVASALAALVWSFGRDTVWLWRSRRAPGLAGGEA